ncbi:TetR/AcrR family transcriptional regulator [Thermoflexus sp.]|uniref:TetR/AcrR family transcriptional regulator n=1 Tax=Thermoflexus sp. TaxID=1969742 RepID=UPI0025EB0712|nr:TetR/AcrR family transcriptional regulator [Thermoflexus sp.]MDW8181097.1 helix-turn-helix domain-containing protein [Anaerolineae bacterium]MCS6962686.1 TetR/AcrR family transcriptional regulator [Thermoflexus sp.]MCS7351639.1 TetR/AcrR family transcriptional regulator [Thermoflexus sp.]MCX7691192.1 TetR/AcrR family transcriptional regulator [Thermoflexus sp.]MDW8184707.1 helix-turn-helix domain-containing protein [Anaerolineae bacterium]
MALRVNPEVRRAQILEAAAQVFARHGFRGATTRAIAQAAGVAEGTIFRYFPTKRHLLLALFEALTIRPIQQQLQALGTMESREWLEAFLAERLTAMRAHLPLMQALYQEIRTDEAVRRTFIEQIARPFLEQMRELLAAALQQRQRSLHPALVLWAIWGALHGVTIFGLEMDPELAMLSPRQIAHELTTLFLWGLEGHSEELAGR